MIQVFSKTTNPPHAYPFLHPGETGVGATAYSTYEPIEFSISPDGQKWDSCFDVSDLEGVYCYKAPDVQPATMTDNLKKVGLQDGQRLLSTSYDTRTITMQVTQEEAIDEPDALLGYDALQKFLVARDPYWICFSNWPQRMYYVKAKVGAPTYVANSWTCTVTFTDLIGLSRSVETSLNYTENNGFGNNMPNKTLQYVFTSNNFTVYNASDTIIDPERRGHPFKMTLEGSSSGNMKITNKTNGDYIHREGSTFVNANGSKQNNNGSFNGTIVIDGVRATLDGKSDQINWGWGWLLTLQPGKNEIQIDNFSGKVTFDFPFWWLS